MENEALTVTLEVIEILEQLKIPYLIGGSLASTLHGFSRTTLDSDLVADVRPEVVATDPERTAYVASPEDTILAKLEWYRLGGEVSDRQWCDILGVIQIQGDRLDFAYLQQGAAALDVAELLTRALARATATGPQSPQLPLDL